MRTLKVFLLLLCTTLPLLAFTASAQAYTYIEYDTAYTDDVDPSGETPWLTALLESPGEDVAYNNDFSFSSGVLLTLYTTNLVDTEYVSKWLFNFTSDKDVEALVFTVISGTQADVSTDSDGINAGGGVQLEINLSFPTKEADRFGSGMITQIWISGIDDLAVEDFLYYYTTAEGEEYLSVAHIQSIGTDDDDSAWVAGHTVTSVPEPSTWLLLGLGLLCLPLVRRLRRG